MSSILPAEVISANPVRGRLSGIFAPPEHLTWGEDGSNIHTRVCLQHALRRVPLRTLDTLTRSPHSGSRGFGVPGVVYGVSRFRSAALIVGDAANREAPVT